MKNQRYSRHFLLDNPKLNEKDLNKQITVIGCGGIGTNFAYLAASLGIKNIHLIDGDIIDISNLNRQNLFYESDIGKSKSHILATKLKQINSEINITYEADNIDQNNIEQIKSEIVIDATDNLQIRRLLNDYCLKTKKELISGATIKTTGYVFTNGEACLSCFLEGKNSETSCGVDGILNGTLFMCASIMISELIKLIKGEKISQLIKFNSYEYSLQTFKIEKNPKCPACNGEYKYLNSDEQDKIRYCSGMYEFKLKNSYEKVKQKIESKHKIKDIEIGFKFEEITVFANGRILIKSPSPEHAQAIYHEYFG